jgi:hypothetical protein
MNCYTGTYIIHHPRYNKVLIVSVSPRILPYDGFVINYDSLLLPFVNEPHYNAFLQLLDYNSSDIEAVSEYVFVDPE